MSYRLPSQFDLAKQSMKESGYSRFNALLYLERPSQRKLRFAWLTSFSLLCGGVAFLVASVLLGRLFPTVSPEKLMVDSMLTNSGYLFVYHFPLFVLCNWAWAYRQWCKKYNEFVAEYSNVLRYKKRLLELEREKVCAAFAKALEKVEEAKHRLFHDLSADADALLALERLPDLDDDGRAVAAALRTKAKEGSQQLSFLEEDENELRKSLLAAAQMLDERYNAIVVEERRQADEIAAEIATVKARAEREGTILLAEERAWAKVLHPIPVLAPPLLQSTKELCDSMKTNFETAA